MYNHEKTKTKKSSRSNNFVFLLNFMEKRQLFELIDKEFFESSNAYSQTKKNRTFYIYIKKEFTDKPRIKMR